MFLVVKVDTRGHVVGFYGSWVVDGFGGLVFLELLLLLLCHLDQSHDVAVLNRIAIVRLV